MRVVDKVAVGNPKLDTGSEPRAAIARSSARQLLSLPDQIAEHIFAAISTGEYAPGDRIREEVLAERFEVSRGPIREALRILEKDAVVRILPNRGAHVTQLSIPEVEDIFEIRRTLNGVMHARLSAEEAMALAAIIEGDVRKLETLAQDVDGHAYAETIFRLGGVIRDACTNRRLADILAALARQTLRYTQLGLATAVRRKQSARNWRTLLKAMKAGNPDGAAYAIENLIDDSRREAVRKLQARAAADQGGSGP